MGRGSWSGSSWTLVGKSPHLYPSEENQRVQQGLGRPPWLWLWPDGAHVVWVGGICDLGWGNGVGLGGQRP